MQKEVMKDINKSYCISIIKRNKGITLIALVITIIVLLILAGISIAMISGQNGIFTQANKAKEETKKAEYKEALEAIRPGLDVERIIDELSNKEFIDRYEEEIKNNNNFEDATVTRKDEETIRVITKEGYVYEITPEGVKYIGHQGEDTPPDLQETDIEFTMNPSTPTRGSVKVGINTKISGYTLQYSTNEGKTWSNYTGEVTVTDNGPIYARLINNLDETGGYATGNVENIDRLAPNTFTPSVTSTTNTITLTGSTTDAARTETDGSSGIKAYYFSRDNGSTWEPANGQAETSYTFNNLTQNTKYQLKMKAVDEAGNETETNTISKTTGTVPGLTQNDTTFSYSPSTPTSGNVLVTITTTVGAGYTLQYSTDETKTWNNYTTAVTMTNNGVIYARLIDSKGQAGEYTTGNVTNIDRTPPTVTISTSDITAASAKLNVTASDSSGIESYKYYLGNELKSTSASSSYNFTGLASGTSYTLKVIVTDKAGLTTEKSTTITTLKTVSDLKAGNRVYYIDKNGVTRECIVLYDSSSSYGIQIITVNTVDTVTLGSTDSNTAINSYNSAITNLNAKADNYLNTTYASSARCVGSVPNNKNAESGYMTEDPLGYNTSNKYKAKDTNHTTDYNQMEALEITKSNNDYWLASRQFILQGAIAYNFCIKRIDNSGKLQQLGYALFTVAYKQVKGNSYTNGFRPVFTLKPGIKITGGDGINTPYTLAP